MQIHKVNEKLYHRQKTPNSKSSYGWLIVAGDILGERRLLLAVAAVAGAVAFWYCCWWRKH